MSGRLVLFLIYAEFNKVLDRPFALILTWRAAGCEIASFQLTPAEFTLTRTCLSDSLDDRQTRLSLQFCVSFISAQSPAINPNALDNGGVC